MTMDYGYLGRNILGFQLPPLKVPTRYLQLLYTVEYKNSKSLFMHYSQEMDVFSLFKRIVYTAKFQSMKLFSVFREMMSRNPGF